MSILSDIGTKVGAKFKELDDKIVQSNGNFLQIKRFSDTTYITSTSTAWQNLYTFTLDNCTIGSKIDIIATFASLWEGSEESQFQIVHNTTTISNTYSQRAVNASGWAMNNSSITAEVIADSASMTFIFRGRGIGGTPRIWYNYPSSIGANSSSFLVIETQ